MKLSRYSPLLLIRAIYSLIHWRIAVRHVSFNRWKHQLNAKCPSRASHSHAPTKEKKQTNIALALELNRHINCVRRHIPINFNCMHRCLALKGLLEQHNVFPHICIGVKINEEGKLDAHAWLTLYDELINDTTDNITQYKEITDTQSLSQRSLNF